MGLESQLVPGNSRRIRKMKKHVKGGSKAVARARLGRSSGQASRLSATLLDIEVGQPFVGMGRIEPNWSIEEHKEDEPWGWTRVAKLCAAANSSRSALDQSCCTRDVKLALTSARYGARHASFHCGSGLPLVSLACFSPVCEGQLCNTRIKWGMQARVHQGRMQSDS